jgi:polyisoprenoid-binding protein YceI
MLFCESKNSEKMVTMKNETKWTIDSTHSEISFKVKHLMIATVRGTFRKFDGNIYTVGSNFLTADINCWIDPASIDTGDEKRDGHLKSPDFFDVMQYKDILFTANGMKEKEADSYELSGTLTIKNISKEIKLTAVFGGVIRDPWGNDRAGFNVTGKINRKDWELTWNTELFGGGVMLSDEIKIECEIQLIKPAEEKKTLTAEKEGDKELQLE